MQKNVFNLKGIIFYNEDKSLLQIIQNCHSSLQDHKGIKIIMLKMCFPVLFFSLIVNLNLVIAYVLEIKEHGSLLAFSSEEYFDNYHRQRNKTQRI